MLRGVCVIVSIFVISTSNLQAQQGVGAGTDMWTGGMGLISLFIPHYNNCDPQTEAFVSVFPTYAIGYCIERTQRSGDYWYLARNTCAQLLKRLPEPAEWQCACEQATPLGLRDMIGDYEWVSNFQVNGGDGNGTGYMNAPVMGLNGCLSGDGNNRIANTNGNSAIIRTFRCVR